MRLETAITPNERERGLMERSSLPGATGMIFVFDHPQTVYFWMKNTPMPLDMLFFDAGGTLLTVHPDAIPEDRSVLASPPGVQYVIEVAGGEAARLHIEPGAQIATWSCSAVPGSRPGLSPTPTPTPAIIPARNECNDFQCDPNRRARRGPSIRGSGVRRSGAAF